MKGDVLDFLFKWFYRILVIFVISQCIYSVVMIELHKDSSKQKATQTKTTAPSQANASSTQKTDTTTTTKTETTTIQKPNVSTTQQTSSSSTTITTGGGNKEEKEESWVDLVIKPIVTNETNQVIFRTLFYLIVIWVVSLALSASSSKLKRLKIFNLEVEMDIAQSVNQTLMVSKSKAMLMEYLTTEDVLTTTLNHVQNNGHVEFRDVLADILADLRKLTVHTLIHRFHSIFITTWIKHLALSVPLFVSQRTCKKQLFIACHQKIFLFATTFWPITMKSMVLR
ncbi:hypothetical protein [Paenibacillus sp. CF384]|uniref:hypothetical protein n=1 Tax=Paenibacillus sp. CF384 TaxID=1884382 RepID=UPI00115F8193|nr:hypothetical protein [Paenibacillus sp. CF384]